MLTVRFFGALLLGMAALGFLLGQEIRASASLEPDTDPWVAQPRTSLKVPEDTLRPSVEAGASLLLPLPSELGDQPVDRYALIRGPALSGVADSSFTWIAQDVEPGTYDVLLRAIRTEAPPDTLVLRVQVQE